MHKRKGDIIVMRRPLMFSTGITREMDLGGGGTDKGGTRKEEEIMFDVRNVFVVGRNNYPFQAHLSVCVER